VLRALTLDGVLALSRISRSEIRKCVTVDLVNEDAIEVRRPLRGSRPAATVELLEQLEVDDNDRRDP
jgi:hypothetical protein